MPANLVRPGLEKYWTRAKEQAEKQGRGGDWAYVVGIYKRMTVNKSEDVGSLEKAQGGVGGVERTYRVRGHPEVIEQLDKQLLMMNYCGSAGCSRDLTLSIDGDGAHWLDVEGVPGELEKEPREKQLGSGSGISIWGLRLKERLQKSAMGGPNALRYFINVRQGGQVPSRERMRELAEAYRPPRPATTARLLDSGKPVYRLTDVFAGLGLDPDAEASWRAMLGPVIEGSGNEVALRQAIYAVMREQKADGALGSAVLERAIKYRANRLQKSVQLVTVDELRKGEDPGELEKSYRAIKTAYEKEYGKGAWGKIKVPEDVQESKAKAEKLPFGSKTKLGPEEKHRYTEAKRRLAGKLGMPKTGWGLYGRSIVGALKQREKDRAEKSEALSKGEARGGSYYRRVPGKSGRHRYYYDQGKYESSADAHLDGETAAKKAIKARVGAMLEKAGKAGMALPELKSLVQRYGSKRVGGVLNDARKSGELTYKAGKLRAQARKEPKQ